MMMTEVEAKTKWCPLVRQLGTLKQPPLAGASDYVVAAGSQNRGYAMGGALDNCRCIASECMAWRRAGKTWTDEKDGSQQQGGYCGAFGRPA
jgi:hypothetical protein